MAYLVLAYPDLSKNDFNLIQAYRKDKDELFFNMVEPHFTVVFPVSDMLRDNFINEVKEKSRNLAKIEFVIRCATISKDAFKDYFHVFLVPDEGYSQIVKMHDQLYSGILKKDLRLDLDFVPHIGIGNSKDKFVCKRMVDAWNEKDFAIGGTISRLTLATYENDSVTILEEIALKEKNAV